LEKISPEAIDLIGKLLERDTKLRLNAENALNHPWFKKFEVKEKYECIPKERIKSFINNLKSYKIDYKLQEAAIAIIVHNLPHSDEIKELEQAFRKIDVNKDGKLTKEELFNGFSNIFPDKTKEENETEIGRIFQNIDADKNGYIEYEEFIRGCINKNNLLNSDNLKFAFRYFDIDGSGQISIKDLIDIFCSGGDKIPKETFERIIGSSDLDGNGQIDFEEFKELMKKVLYPENL